MAKVVHQALVRRDVVLQLIQGAKNRGHRAYRNVNMERARLKAQSLPAHGVPPELIKVLPHDDHLDKILVQKSATPVSGRKDLEGAGDILNITKPNAVVLEKSSFDDADINAQRIRALQHLTQNLGVQIQSDDVDDTQEQEPAAKKTQTNDAGHANTSSL